MKASVISHIKEMDEKNFFKFTEMVEDGSAKNDPIRSDIFTCDDCKKLYGKCNEYEEDIRATCIRRFEQYARAEAEIK